MKKRQLEARSGHDGAENEKGANDAAQKAHEDTFGNGVESKEDASLH